MTSPARGPADPLDAGTTPAPGSRAASDPGPHAGSEPGGAVAGTLWRLAWAVSAALAIASVAEKVVDVLDRSDDYRVSEDLSIYQDAVVALLHDGWLYSTDHFRMGEGLFFIYPPFAALLMAPLGYIETAALAIVWQLGLLVVLAFSLWALARAEGLRTPVRWAGALLGPAILLYPVESNFHYGQINLVLLALVVADLCGVIPERFRGVGVGVAAGIKLTPLGFLLVLAVRGRWRACGVALGTVAATVALAWAVLPAESRFYWSQYAWDTGRAGARLYRQNQSITGVLLRTGLDESTVDAVYPVLAVALVVAVVFSARVLHRRGLETACIAVVGLGIALAAPMSFQHHWYWVVLLVVMAASDRYRSWSRALFLLLVLFVVDPVQWFMKHDWSVRRELPVLAELCADLVFLGTLAALVAVTVSCVRWTRADPDTKQLLGRIRAWQTRTAQHRR